MLTLTRKQNESIRIAEDIELTVLRIAGGCVRIGINAPKDVPVVRHELMIESEIAANRPSGVKSTAGCGQVQ